MSVKVLRKQRYKCEVNGRGWVTATLVTNITPPPPPQIIPPPSPRLFRVQVGAFGVRSNAENLRVRIVNAGFSDTFITTGNDGLHRVQVGAFSVRANADALRTRLVNAGFRDAFVNTN